MAKPFGHTQHVGYISDPGVWNKLGLDSNENLVLSMKIKNHKNATISFAAGLKIDKCIENSYNGIHAKYSNKHLETIYANNVVQNSAKLKCHVHIVNVGQFRQCIYTES